MSALRRACRLMLVAALGAGVACLEVPERDDRAPDAGEPDAAAFDGSALDRAMPDGSAPGVGAPDGALVEPTDIGPADAGEPDAGEPDAAPLDPATCAPDEVAVPGADVCLRFVRLNDLPAPRADHLMAVLPDGAVLVVGGTENGGPHGEVPTLVLSALDDAWSAHPQPVTPRLGATLTWVEGRALLAGGQLLADQNAVVTTVESWDPVDAVWREEPQMAAPHTLHGALAYGGGLLLMGGRDGVQETAAVTAWPAPLPEMPPSLVGARRFPSVFPLGDALVQVAGQLGGTAVSDTWVWRPGQARWMSFLRGDTPPLAIYSREASDGNTIVRTGGRDNQDAPLTTVRLFDLDRNWTTPGALSAGRERHLVEVIDDGLFVVLGGGDGGDLVRVDPPGVFAFAVPEDFEARRIRSAIVRLSDGSLVVAGGRGPLPDSYLADAWHISLRRLAPPDL